MKPSTRMHEVFNLVNCSIEFCGSQSACLRYVSNSHPRKRLVVRPAGR